MTDISLGLTRPSQQGKDQNALNAVHGQSQERAADNVFFAPKTMFRPDPDQPRKTFRPETIKERQRQMEEFGQLKPIEVYSKRYDETTQEEYYPIRDGECRWRAAMQSEIIEELKFEIVYDDPENKSHKILTQLIANDEGSEAVPVMERAAKYAELVALLGSQIAVLEKLKIDKGEFSRIVSLVNLPEKIKKVPEKLGIQDAKVLHGLGKLEAHQSALADEAINELESNAKIQSEGGEGVSARAIVDKHAARLPKKKNKAKLKGERKPRPMPIKELTVTTAGANIVLEIEKARETLRFIITSEHLEIIQAFQKE